MSRFRWIAVCCVLLAPALWQQGCGTVYPPVETTAEVVQEVTVVQQVEKEVIVPAPTAEPEQEQPAPPGATLTFGQWGSMPPDSFCTLGQSTGTEDWWLRRLVSATLGTLAADGGWVPGLANSWEVSDDATSFTFNLRQGVTWHDGAPFTAYDVQFTFDLILDPAVGPYYAVFSDVLQQVQALDDYTVVFTMAHPVNWADFGARSDFRSLVEGWSPVPQHLLDGALAGEICYSDWATTGYPGLGPYQVQVPDSAPDQYVRLYPYAGYYGDPAGLDEIEIYFSENPGQLFADLVDGKADMVQITPELVDKVAEVPYLFLPENTSLLAVNKDRIDWPPQDPYLYHALVEPQGETFVPYRESPSELGSIIGNATLLPQHPETSAAIAELAPEALGFVRINKARTVTWWGNPEVFHLAPLGPESAPADPDAFWQAVQEHAGFVIATLVVVQDPPVDGGRAQPFAVRVHGTADSPEVQFVRPDGGTERVFTQTVRVEMHDEAIDIPTAGIEPGSAWCKCKWLGITIWYPCW